MSLLQALAYFFVEATRTLLSNWRSSMVAVGTCALSLFVGGFFLMVGANVAGTVEDWQESMKISVFLAGDPGAAELERLRAAVAAAPWIESAEIVGRAEARERFDLAFPSVAEALGDQTDLDLPASIEGVLRAGQIDELALAEWVRALEEDEFIDAVDDDRDWIGSLRKVAVWSRTAGVGLGLALLIAAALTIAAVVRLVAVQYLDEISVLRLVGATEFFVRGPFVAEGILQGFCGSAVSLLALAATRWALVREGGDALWVDLAFGGFLTMSQVLAIVALGTAAGLAGALFAIRRESLVPADE